MTKSLKECIEIIIGEKISTDSYKELRNNPEAYVETKEGLKKLKALLTLMDFQYAIDNGGN